MGRGLHFIITSSDRQKGRAWVGHFSIEVIPMYEEAVRLLTDVKIMTLSPPPRL